MQIRHLEFFVTLAEERHFGRAAELCGVSQPALSLAIRKLEEDLGAPLILRGQRFMGLTAEGERVLASGRRMLADYGGLRDDLHGRRKGGLTGRLRLGVIASAMPLVAGVTARFEAKNPLARIEIALATAHAIADGVEQFALDGGLTWAARAKTPLWQGPMVFACHRDHPFAAGEEIGWRDALTQPLCLTRDAMDGPLAARDTAAAISCASLDGVLAHLRGGDWCAIVPQAFRVLLAPQDEIVLRELPGPAAQIGLLTAQREPQSPMVLALRACA